MPIKYKFGDKLLLVAIILALISVFHIETYARPNRNYENVLEEFYNENTVVAEHGCLKTITLLKISILTFIVGTLFVYAIHLFLQSIPRSTIYQPW